MSPAGAVRVDVDAVTALVERVGQEVVLPRWRDLTDGDIADKGGGDLVTVVDQAAEDEVTAGLRALAPHIPVIGEEATASNPELVDGMGDEPAVFVVDPIDGTRAFVDGLPDFAVMVALVVRGTPLASWISLPALGHTWVAERGLGVFLDGAPFVAPWRPETPRAALALTTRRERAELVDTGARAGLPGMGVDHPLWAGRYYTRFAAGEVDALGYWSGWPWDHAPGTVIVRELGGVVVAADGSDYRAAGHSGPIVVASSRGVADRMRSVIAADPQG
jgi:fructose-1,6-bisphosphatase/inositol monophosphatase family enzyme